MMELSRALADASGPFYVQTHGIGTMDNLQKFRTIISTVLGIPVDQVGDDLSSEKVDTWDSLNHISLIGALEQEFGVTLVTDNLADAMSVPRLRALLAERGVELT